jgi:hypothetical protein
VAKFLFLVTALLDADGVLAPPTFSDAKTSGAESPFEARLKTSTTTLGPNSEVSNFKLQTSNFKLLSTSTSA